MKKYMVTLVYHIGQTIEVEADNEELAEDLAVMQSVGSLCHQCSKPFDDHPELVQVITEEISGGD